VKIFIDESGTFLTGEESLAVSCAGALVVPQARWTELLRRYERIRPTLLATGNAEVKGRLLSEDQVRRVIALLLRYDAVFAVVAIDGRLFDTADIQLHRELQGERIVANPLGNPNPAVAARLEDWRRRLFELSDQLYVQTTVMTTLVTKVLRTVPLFFAQRRPRELSAFEWVIDAKGTEQLAPVETWWQEILSSCVQSDFIREPMAMLRSADYSHFAASYPSTISPSLRQHIGESPTEAFAVNVGQIVRRNFRFSSAPEPGLELVDVLTNAVRRAMRSSLGKRGWELMPQLMIERPRHYIDLVTLAEAQNIVYPYLPVLRHFSTGGKALLTAGRVDQDDIGC